MYVSYPIILAINPCMYPIKENSEAMPGLDPGDFIPIYHHIPRQIAMQNIE